MIYVGVGTVPQLTAAPEVKKFQLQLPEFHQFRSTSARSILHPMAVHRGLTFSLE
jgi:hypothetical protein